MRQNASTRALPPRAALILGLALAPLALATQALGAPPAPSSIGSPGSMQNETTPGQAALPAAMAAKMNDHIQKLHAQLAITAAEEPQWDQYATVMRQNAADMNQAYEDRAAKLDTMNASENMQSYAHVTQVHAANMEKLANAFAPLYASFSPEQKSAADRMFQNKAEMHEHRKS